MKKKPSADQGDDSCDIDGFGLFSGFCPAFHPLCPKEGEQCYHYCRQQERQIVPSDENTTGYQ